MAREEYPDAIHHFIYARDSVFNDLDDEEYERLTTKIDSSKALYKQYQHFTALVNESDSLLNINEPEEILRADSLIALAEKDEYKAGEQRLKQVKATMEKQKVVKAVEYQKVAEGLTKLGNSKEAKAIMDMAKKLEKDLFSVETKANMNKVLKKRNKLFNRQK